MHAAEQGLVRIVRDFLEAHQLMHRLFARTAEGLRFVDLQELVGDDEASVLFRLKERSHELFRGQGEKPVAVDREALFDLAVGSLFHEAMSLRENLYQREVYGPRVRELRERADADSATLFEEFGRILGAVEGRVAEGLDEALALTNETALQLRRLLVLHADNGLVTRFLIEHAERSEAVFGLPFGRLLEKIHGEEQTAYRRAADSYLDGGHYAAALDAYQRALQLAGKDPLLERRIALAQALSAYLDRDHRHCVAQLTRWAEASGSDPPAHARLARAALTGALPLAEDDDAPDIVDAASALLERLERGLSAS